MSDMSVTAQKATKPEQVTALPSLASASRVWFKIVCLSFGGPAGQIALLYREVVDERRWVCDRRFLHALNFCHLLPEPEAQQLAIYLGWLMHGPIGGLSAGLLFVIPGAVVMLALSTIYATLGTVAHDHPELPPDHPHLQDGGHAGHAHPIVIDRLHPAWP